MGRIGLIVNVESLDEADVSSNEITIDLGGGQIVQVSQYGVPGLDAKPLTDDLCATVTTPGEAGETAVGFLDPANISDVENGEVRLYSRDADGTILASVRCYQDGKIRLENDNGYIELGANGRANLNGHLTVEPE